MKHIITSLLFLITTTVFADPAPFGLEIGKATVADVEKMYGIEKIGNTEVIAYKVDVNQVDFDGLKELILGFNEKGVLAIVIATLPKSQFKSIHKSLAKKYKVVNQEIPFVGASYAEYVNGSTEIYIDAPHLSFDMTMGYINSHFASAINAKVIAEKAAKKKSQEDKL